MDPCHLHHLRHEQLLAEAAEQRLGHQCRRAAARRPGLALRVYTRVWWASRPRVGAWPRSVLGS